MAIEILDRERVDWLTVQHELSRMANIIAVTVLHPPQNEVDNITRTIVAAVLGNIANSLGAGINAAAIRAAENAELDGSEPQKEKSNADESGTTGHAEGVAADDG